MPVASDEKLTVSRMEIPASSALTDSAQATALEDAFSSPMETSVIASAEVAGVGLHSGESVRLRIQPAPAGAGLAFRRSDLGPMAEASAKVSNVVATTLGTQLAGDGGSAARTVEHVLAALALNGVDNALLDLTAAEAPIVDGSAAPFAAAIEAAGIQRLSAPRRYLTISTPIELTDGDRLIRAEPFDGRRLDVEIAFDDAAIGAQSTSLDLAEVKARQRLLAARTFCRRADIDAMRAAGFCRGGSLENAIVVDGETILNPEGLRDPDEFVLHKALDLVGDLALVGAPIVGRIVARRPGHDLNTRFAALLAEAFAVR